MVKYSKNCLFRHLKKKNRQRIYRIIQANKEKKRMRTLRKILTVGLALMLTFCVSSFWVGCDSEKEPEKDKKYDVTIRIACDDGGEWVFPPDVDEIRIERTYNGMEHRYYVDAYQLADKPGWENAWITPSGEGANVFQLSILHIDDDGNYNTELKKVCSRGKYIITVDASKTSNLWEFREVYLYITVM